jgi:hypothetical protein
MVTCKINSGNKTAWYNVPVDNASQNQCGVSSWERSAKFKEMEVQSMNGFRSLRQKIYKEGGKWQPEGSDILFEVSPEGWIYQTIMDKKEGVAVTTITALDYIVPFTAELHTDLQGVAPEKRKKLLAELELEASRLDAGKPPTVTPPPASPPVTVPPVSAPPVAKPTATPVPIPRADRPEIIVVQDKDWLSKISLTRWGTVKWEPFLKPTTATLERRRKKNEDWDPNLIYPGDTFEVLTHH